MNIIHKIAYAVGGKNRARKYLYFMEKLRPEKSTTILDVGADNEEYSDNDNYLEKHYPFTENITTLSINASDALKKRYPKIHTVVYDGKAFPFADAAFDICWSNAVIEHVGSYENQLFFLKEFARVGKKRFLTTPNRFFPVEVHTRIPLLHFLPKNIFDRLLRLFGAKWAAGDYMHLLSKNTLVRMLKDAGITKYEIKSNRLLGFTLDFVIIF